MIIDLGCHAQQIFEGYFVCHQDLSEYVSLENIEPGFHSEPGLKKHHKIYILTSTTNTTQHFIRRVIFSRFLALTNTWALVTGKKLQSPPKKPCMVTVIAPPT